MQQPEENNDGSGKFCRLKKSLYGLKQASRVWNTTIDAELKKIGLERARSDQCIYYRVQGVSMLFLAIYVDDILIFTNDTEQEIIVRTKLSERFKMKYMGKASSILGVRIQFDEITGQIEIDQERYIKDILKRFKMDDWGLTIKMKNRDILDSGGVL